jgi:putative ABC transport system permease protein
MYRRAFYYLHRDEFDRELEEELQNHLDLKAREIAKDGLPAEEARRAATLQLGNRTLIRETSREVFSFSRLETLIQDLKYGFRMLFKNDFGFALAAIVILALGIGATTTTFSLLNAVLLKPLAYPDPDRIVALWRYGNSVFSGPDFADLKDQSEAFEDLSALNATGLNLAGPAFPERVQGMMVSANFFRILRAQPALGRTFLDNEDRPEASPVVVISNTLWRDRFDSNPETLGKTINLNGKSYTIIGVMPATFAPPYHRADVIVPLTEDLRAFSRDNNFLNVIGRIKPGVTIQQAQSDAAKVGSQIDQGHPLNYGRRQFRVMRLQDVIAERGLPIFAVLVAAVVFVLFIACANVAGLLLSRAVARQREVSIRSALGASRSRLVQQLLCESFLLALPGGALGLVLAIQGTAMIIRGAPEYVLEYAPGLRSAGANGRVLWAALCISLLTAILSGLAPALHSARRNISGSLNEVGRASTPGAAQSKLTRGFAAAEAALAFVLLVGASLSVRTLIHVTSSHPGLDPQNIVTAQLASPATRSQAPGQRAMFLREVLEKVRALRGVDAAGEISEVPLSDYNSYWRFYVGGSGLSGPEEPHDVRVHFISEGCFEALRIPVLDGRSFSDQDSEGAQPVLIINKRMAGLFWPDGTAVGRQIRVHDQWTTIIGVVGNVRNSGTFQEDPEVYLPYQQYAQAQSDVVCLAVRTTADQSNVASDIRHAVRQVDPGQALYDVRSMQQVISDSTFPQRMTVWLLVSFAAVALLLAGAGIYSVMAYSVARRTSELGIRMALGATRSDLVKTVLKGGLLIASSGLVVGLAAGLGLARLMAAILYGVPPSDPPSFATAFLLLLSISLAACYLPARRAARVDPVISLRHE